MVDMAAPARPDGGSKLLQLAWTRYMQQLEKKPLRTKAITAACVASLSDVIAQRLLGTRYSPARTIKMALWGLLFSGPSSHYWFSLQHRIFAASPNSRLTTIRKVLLEQSTFGPLFTFCFMAWTSIAVNGLVVREFPAKAVREYPALLVNNWKVWPLVSFINHSYVPLQLRVLFVNMISLFWSTYVITSTRATAPAAAKARRIK